MAPPPTAIDLIPWDNTYARLPQKFFARVRPAPVAAPRLIRLNDRLARELGLDPSSLQTPEGIEVLAGNRVPANSEPLAMAYAGHQFGHFVPQLGDGRAILLGEVIDCDQHRRDVQLKGAGRTPWSRGGDGRAALGPVLREYLLSEAMAALGIPTARALAAVATGETVWRETPRPGAILTRVAASHIRVGTFQYFAARRDLDGVRTLADYVIKRHYPECVDAANPWRAMLDAVIRRQAELVAQWMLVGFIHGVMNTDNMSISGETIDYGPCAFMDHYNPAQVYSFIDSQGRYSYSNQPRVAHWNLARLAETMLELLAAGEEARIKEAEAALEAFPAHFETAYEAGLRRKLGLKQHFPEDRKLAQDLLDLMARNRADFTLTFRGLCSAVISPSQDGTLRGLFANPAELDLWLSLWRQRLARESSDPEQRRASMLAANPLQIPRNHLVEEVIAAANEGDFQPFETLLSLLSSPCAEPDQPEQNRYTLPPRPEQIVLNTFCGT